MPYIGPAIATQQLLESPTLRQQFRLIHLDTSDPEGMRDIGRFSGHNVVVAVRHLLRCWSLLLRHRPDVVYLPLSRGIWGFLRDALFMASARLVGSKPLAHLRCGRFDLRHDHGFLGRLIARIGLASASRGLVLCESLADIFGPTLPGNRLALMSNGIEIARFTPPDRSARTYPPRIAYLANLFEAKGAHVLLQALPAIIAAVPDLVVTFAGGWRSSEYRERCMRMVQENGLQAHVEFVGELDEVRKQALLAASDIAVFVPVKSEGLPWSVLEAMAMELPVVGTPQGAMREVIVDEKTGYLVPPKDATALAERVIALARDPELRRRLGRAGRIRVEASYNSEGTHRQLVEIALESIEHERVPTPCSSTLTSVAQIV